MPGTSPRTPKRSVEPIEMRSTAQRLNARTPATKKPPRGRLGEDRLCGRFDAFPHRAISEIH